MQEVTNTAQESIIPPLYLGVYSTRCDYDASHPVVFSFQQYHPIWICSIDCSPAMKTFVESIGDAWVYTSDSMIGAKRPLVEAYAKELYKHHLEFIDTLDKLCDARENGDESQVELEQQLDKKQKFLKESFDNHFYIENFMLNETFTWEDFERDEESDNEK